jgi:hypothetical protein
MLERDRMSTYPTLTLRVPIAFIWLVTGLGVLHPFYREVGRDYLGRLGLPEWFMYAACVLEVLLALDVLLMPPRHWLTLGQVTLIGFYTILLACFEPPLLVNPFGVLSKNIPLIALILAAQFVESEGWSARALWTLRAGMAFIWIWEGLLPCVFFQDDMLSKALAITGLSSDNLRLLLIVMGLAQAGGGVAALLLRGRLLQLLLACQVLGLIVISVLVTIYDPLLWWHPFGPVTKNIPLILGTALAMWVSEHPPTSTGDREG